MDENTKTTVRQILDQYLETNKRRKTSERNTILDAIYSIPNNFSLEELDKYLEKECKFIVSRGTLYNTLRLFVELHLVVRYNTNDGTRFEACFGSKGHCRRICTVCGKVMDVKSKIIDKSITNLHFMRFHKLGYSIYIYGICSSCQAKMTKQTINGTKKKNKKTL